MSTLYGSVRCSMLPGLSIYEREDTPALVAMREQVRAIRMVFPFVVSWESPFYTPDGWDYNWGYHLCTDLDEARRVADDEMQAGVYRTEITEGTEYDHPHSPEGWCRLYAGDEMLYQSVGGKEISLEESRFNFT